MYLVTDIIIYFMIHTTLKSNFNLKKKVFLNYFIIDINIKQALFEANTQ